VKISKALSIRLYYDVLSPAENVAKGLLDVREMKKDVVKLLPPPPHSSGVCDKNTKLHGESLGYGWSTWLPDLESICECNE